MAHELDEAREWLRKASHDRRAASASLRETPPITDAAAFHAQQDVEKLLKAFLTARGVEFERIHDLAALADMCALKDPTFAALKQKVAPLTPYAVRFRYPGSVDPSEQEVHTALAVADEVERFVLDRLHLD